MEFFGVFFSSRLPLHVLCREIAGSTTSDSVSLDIKKNVSETDKLGPVVSFNEIFFANLSRRQIGQICYKLAIHFGLVFTADSPREERTFSFNLKKKKKSTSQE